MSSVTASAAAAAIHVRHRWRDVLDAWSGGRNDCWS